MNKNKIDLVILDKIAEETGVDKEDIIASLADAINQAYDKKNGIDDNDFEIDKAEVLKRRIVEIDKDTGEITVLFCKDVVEEVTDSATQISLEDARRDDPDFQIGDVYEVDITPANFQELGRVMAHHTKSMFTQKVTERERSRIMDEYKCREGEIVTCVVETIEKQNVGIDEKGKPIYKKRIIVRVDKKIEGNLEFEDQLPTDTYEVNQIVKAYLVKVADKKERMKKRKGDKKQNDAMKEPVLKLSRTNAGFLRRLFEKEIPEVELEKVVVKGIARNPGQRAKVAVMSTDPNIDPITACVGQNGNRIAAIMEELGGEKIDVIRYSPDLVEYVENALSPARCKGVNNATVFEEEVENKEGRIKTRQVVSLRVPDDQLTLAIGNKGVNVTLAAKLCNCRIDIKGISGAETSARSELQDIFA